MAGEEPRSAEVLVDELLSTPAAIAQLQADPTKTLNEAKERVLGRLPLTPDGNDAVYKKVVGYLGLIGIFAVASWAIVFVISIVTFVLNKGEMKDLQTFLSATQVPSGIVALGSAAVGALAGLLAPSPNR